MIVSTALCSIPFLSSTDATRLQFSAKQIAQTVTSPNSSIPFTICDNYNELTKSSKIFILIAKSDGEIIFKNEDLIIVKYNNDEIEIHKIPKFKHTFSNFATTLRNCREVGSFKENDVIFEYDCFIDAIPTFGQNANVAFMSWFGFNFEDSMVVSESFLKSLKTNKYEQVIIPIFKRSFFKYIYPDSNFKIIPDINNHIDGTLLAIQNKINNDIIKLEKVFEQISPITSRLKNAKVIDITIQKNPNDKVVMINSELNEILENQYENYKKKCFVVYNDLSKKVGENIAKKIITKYYLTKDKKIFDTHGKQVAYVINVTLQKTIDSVVGDKFTTRYANKGVVAFVIPDSIRPYNPKTNEFIDVILGPLSIFSRMIFGQIIEGLINKTIQKCNKIIIEDKNKIPEIIIKLAKLSELLNNNEYANNLYDLAKRVDIDAFHASVKKANLFFECKGFINVSFDKVVDYIKTEFDVVTNDDLIIPKELIKLMHEKLEVKEDLINQDITLPNIFNAPSYMMKLKHLSESRFSHRNYGEYNISTKQPKESEIGENRGSRLGYMEFDALLSHNMITAIKEFRSVKSDSINLKKDLLMQTILNDEYHLPEKDIKSYTKFIIDGLVPLL